jgi:hypothetical protein
MEENALQLINRTSLQNLLGFITNPSSVNLRLLIPAPALFAVADHEFNEKIAQIDPTTLGVFQWIYIRAFVVLHQLTGQGSAPMGTIVRHVDEYQKVLICQKSQ